MWEIDAIPPYSNLVIPGEILIMSLAEMRMRLGQFLYSSVLLLWSVSCQAQSYVQVLPGAEPVCVFAGENVTVPLKLRNSGTNSEAVDLHVKISQVATGIVMPIGTRSVKAITILAGQTLLENAPLELPDVKAETTFVLQWLRGTNVVIGLTKVAVSPRGALAELGRLSAGKPIALLDPDNLVREVLKAAGLETVDLDPEQSSSVGASLAIICSGNSKPASARNLARCAQSLAKDEVGVIWICPPGSNSQALAPSIEVKRGSGESALVLADRALLADFSQSPCAQKRLLQLARIALGKATLSSLEPNLKEPQ